jgi:hypothetical protein
MFFLFLFKRCIQFIWFNCFTSSPCIEVN